jgi:hypothetical protein
MVKLRLPAYMHHMRVSVNVSVNERKYRNEKLKSKKT